MFDVGPMELALLAVLAIIIFGPEKLPELARKAARVLHFLRGIANNAQSTLSRELGTDVDLRDLNPRAFVQKHLLDEVQPVIDDVKKDLMQADAAVRAEVDEVRTSIARQETTPGGRSISTSTVTERVSDAVAGASAGVSAASAVLARGGRAPFDTEAT